VIVSGISRTPALTSAAASPTSTVPCATIRPPRESAMRATAVRSQSASDPPWPSGRTIWARTAIRTVSTTSTGRKARATIRSAVVPSDDVSPKGSTRGAPGVGPAGIQDWPGRTCGATLCAASGWGGASSPMGVGAAAASQPSCWLMLGFLPTAALADNDTRIDAAGDPSAVQGRS